MYQFGLIAKDIKHSVSPTVYRTLGASLKQQVDYEIKNIPEEQLADTVEYARIHWTGFNVTMPYKQKILAYMDEQDESAENCGSTNTVLVRDGRLIAYNTDGWGLVEALRMEGFDFHEKKVVLVGAGGVAFSIAYHLSVSGVARVDVINLIPEQTQSLCKKFGSRFVPHALSYENMSLYAKDADLFINASVMGQIGYDDYTEFDFLAQLKQDAVVFDVNYSNPDAALLKHAAQMGRRTYVGSCMTACQAIRVMQIWTGLTPEGPAVRELIAMLNKKTQEQ